MKSKRKIFSKTTFFTGTIVLLILSGAPKAWANHLSIDNFEMYALNEASDTITYTCDIAWENSWKNTNSQDAVWIFLKYSVDSGQTWQHASMSTSGTNPSGFHVPYNFELIVPDDEKGFFLQRTDLTSGSVNAENVRFVWDYAQDGLTDAEAKAATTINKIFGVEMVYIPAGSFYLGDGDSASEYHFVQGSADTEPWYIRSEDSITTTNGASGGYYYQSSGSPAENATGSVFIIPSSFPKGYQDFYLMKYELTEGQWVAFFNTLAQVQKPQRDITSGAEGGKGSDAVVMRNTVNWDAAKPTSPAETLRPDRPVSYISWPDLLAYADWAGLRPITEMEFEKAARGKDVAPVANEYAWGTAAYDTAQSGEIYPSNMDEDGTEQIFDGNANINRNSLGWSSGDGRSGGIAEGQPGPLRVGIFAESSTGRVTSGAGYYGNMELSGNLSEMVVTVGNAQGRQFLGSHGDGILTTVSGYEGNATNLDWPGINAGDPARGITGTTGSGYRGGDFASSSASYLQTSSRYFAAKDPDSLDYDQRYDASFGVYQGGRLGRTAP